MNSFLIKERYSNGTIPFKYRDSGVQGPVFDRYNAVQIPFLCKRTGIAPVQMPFDYCCLGRVFERYRPLADCTAPFWSFNRTVCFGSVPFRSFTVPFRSDTGRLYRRPNTADGYLLGVRTGSGSRTRVQNEAHIK